MGPSSVTSIFIAGATPFPCHRPCQDDRVIAGCHVVVWCERGDLNPHGHPRDPKSRASASSATLAWRGLQEPTPASWEAHTQTYMFLCVFCTVGCVSLSTHTPAGWTCVHLRAPVTVHYHFSCIIDLTK